MSYMKRYYEEHFDEDVSYSELVEYGLTEEEIYEQWAAFSQNQTWAEFRRT